MSSAENARRRAMIIVAKLIQCQKCGNDDYDLLTFDHIIPVKRPNGNMHCKDNNININGAGNAIVRAILRGDDCSNIMVLCANCHMKKTKIERRSNQCPSNK